MESETENSTRKKERPLLTTFVVLCIFLLVVIVAALVLPAVALRYVFSRIESETGIAITFGKAYLYLADGSFLYIDGLNVKRQNHSSLNLDLQAESVRMPAMFPNDFYSPVLLITGLRGMVEKVGNKPADEGEQKQDASTSKKYALHALMLVDAEVDFIDRTFEQPFQTTIQIEKLATSKTDIPSVFAPYVCLGHGYIGSAELGIISHNDRPRISLAEVPLGFLAPYAPVLNDIFVSGSMIIFIDDWTDEIQKKLRVHIRLQPDCKIKPANEILVPAIQTALRQLDQSSMPELRDVGGKIERLKTSAESVRSRLDEVARIVDRLSVLAPRDVREEYEKFKSQYDKAMAAYTESNAKFETLSRELDQIKIRIVEDTFQAFIDSGVPIEIELQEINGKWQYDGYAVVVGLIEKNYRTIIATEYQRRIQEVRDSVDRLLVP